MIPTNKSLLSPQAQLINSTNTNNLNMAVPSIKIIKNSANDNSGWITVQISSPSHSPKTKIQNTKNIFSNQNRYASLSDNDQTEENITKM